MKKFLTVLLALSVVFTYSFSSVGAVFADTSSENLEKLKEAKAIADKMADTYYSDALEAIVKTTATDVSSALTTASAETKVTEAEAKTAWDSVNAKDALKQAINDAYVAEVNGGFGQVDTDAAVYAAKVFGLSTKANDGTELIASAITDNVKTKLETASGKAARLNLYNTKKAELVDAYDKVDYSLYLNEVDPTDADGRTYLKQAQDKVAAALKAIAENSAMTPSADVATFDATALANAVKAVEDKVSGDLVAILIEGTQYETGLYKVNGVKTSAEVEEAGRDEAALIAIRKAELQKNYADALKVSTNDKANVEAYLTAYTYLIENFVNEVGTSTPAYDNNKDWKTAVKQVEEFKVFAEKHKAEKDSTGAYVRDSEAVDKEVELAVAYTYGTSALANIVKLQTAPYKSISAAETAIKNMSVKTDAAALAFAKEVAKAAAEKAKADVIDDYYAKEAAKVEAKFAEIIAEIEAATTTAKVTAAQNKIASATNGIDNKAAVDGKFQWTNAGAAKDDFDAVKAYIVYNHSKYTLLDAGYIEATDVQVQAALAKIYGEAGARTNAEIKALDVDAATVGASLPTVGQKTDAKNAVKAAIEALPAKATEADLDLVKAAWKAAKSYKDLGETVETTLNAKLTAAIGQVKTDMLKNLTIAYAQLDKKDKAAVKELKEKIDAAVELAAKDNLFGTGAAADTTFDTLSANIESTLIAIRGTELDAVKKAINAIPLNITLDEKAQIEAARALYDAFVEEWTSYETPAYNAAAKVTNFRELALAEAALSVLEKDAAKKATESLKLSVSTKLYKNSKIRVNWKVKGGDASYIDGYQVWKSKKAQSGYTYMGKTKKLYMDNKKGLKQTKKGTRMYYKVRAFVEIDGQKYYSDWSNKGNRIWR